MEEAPQAVSYIRVSTIGQVDGASLDTQERRCQEWALQHGVLITRTFREAGASAKTAERPVLKDMLVYLAEHHREIRYLLVYEIDRLTRNVDDFVEITKILKQYGVELKDPSSSLEGSKSDKLIRYIKAIAAEMDNDAKSERVSDNMKRHASDGYRMAKAPYGLRNIRDLFGKSTVEAVADIAEPVAYLLTEFSKGIYTIKELISLANERNLVRPNGKPMNHMFMGKILRQPLYAGLERNKHTGGELVDSVFDGIITKQAYYRIQQLLERRKVTKTEGYHINHADYPLRRFVRCVTCRRPIRGSASTGASGKTYPRYHCDRCKRASVRPDELNSKFLNLLEGVTPNELSLKLMKTMIVRVWNDELKTLHSERKSLQVSIDKLLEYKHKVTEKVVADDITKREKVELHRKADEKINVLQDTATKLGKQIGTKQEAIDYALDYMDDAPRVWSDASPDMRVTYQAMVFPEGLEYNFYTKQFGTPKLSELYTLANIQKGAEAPDDSTMVNQVRANWNNILTEITTWYDILKRSYQLKSSPALI